MTRILEPGQYFGRRVLERAVGGLRVVGTTYRRGERLPRHGHASAYLLVVVRGGFLEGCRSRVHVCDAGSFVLNVCGADHDDRIEVDGTGVLNVELDARWLESLRELRARVDGPCYVGAPVGISRAWRLGRALAEKDAASALVAESILADLVSRAASVRTPRSPERPAWLAALEEELRASFRDPPSLSDLAARAGVAPTHAAHAFRDRVGCSMGEFVRELRLDHARRRIEGSSAPLADVALESGFADQSHMTNEFRRRYGITPAKLRR